LRSDSAKICAGLNGEVRRGPRIVAAANTKTVTLAQRGYIQSSACRTGQWTLGVAEVTAGEADRLRVTFLVHARP
jgi:hypothetical protein